MNRTAHPDRDTLARRQLERLGGLIDAIVPANRFYSAKLEPTGLARGVASLDAFTAQMVFTTKDELVADQLAHPPYGTNLTFPIERYTRFNQTSATTGTAMRWLDTPESWDGMLDNWRQVYEAATVGPADRLLFAFSFGPFLGFWTAFEAATRLGCLCLPAGGMSSTARLETILANEVTVLCCTPTYAIRLAEVAEAEGVDLSASRVRLVIVAGEPGGAVPAVRARIEGAWPGARVFDHHGMTEVGPVSFECPARPGVLHVIEEAYLPEIVDPVTDGPTLPGESGELVLTTLTRTGSPLLRYRTGDLVRAATERPCVCGRYEMSLVGGILGRTDDMVLVRGVNVYPGAVDQIVRRRPEVAEYRVDVRTERAMTELRVSVEPTPDCSDRAGLARTVAEDLRDAFSLRIPVEAVEPGGLPRFEMKARRWVRH